MTHYPDILETPSPQVAIIREAECIGCTKCIQACPVDAIIGAAKQMHTVLGDECIGCGLCLPPCPVDCIDLASIPELPTAAIRHKIQHAKVRFDARNLRLEKAKHRKRIVVQPESHATRKIPAISLDEIQAAIARAKLKRHL